MERIRLEFKRNEKHDKEEFDRQLSMQEDGLNSMTVEEYLNNMKKYHKGESEDDRKTRLDARKDEHALKIDELMDADENLTEEEAKAQADEWLKDKDALHTVDKVAGGNPKDVQDVGDRGVNRSIGAQWEHGGHAYKLEKHVKQQVTEKENELKEKGLTDQEFKDELKKWKQETYLDIELTQGIENNPDEASSNDVETIEQSKNTQSRAPPTQSEETDDAITRKIKEQKSNKADQSAESEPNTAKANKDEGQSQ